MTSAKTSITLQAVAKPSQPMEAAEIAAWRARREHAIRQFLAAPKLTPL
jgi:hypothetical protein